MNDRKERILVLDVETKHSFEEVGGRENISKMGFSITVVYDYSTDSFTSYFENSAKQLVSHILASELIVGYNIIGFIIIIGVFSIITLIKKKLKQKPYY